MKDWVEKCFNVAFEIPLSQSFCHDGELNMINVQQFRRVYNLMRRVYMCRVLGAAQIKMSLVCVEDYFKKILVIKKVTSTLGIAVIGASCPDCPASCFC